MITYTIYKITNLINNMIYVGRHKTNNLNDGYLGSGLRIQRAVKKYGEENFTKEILMICKDANEMCDIEELLVDQSFVDRKDTYNLIIGGMNDYTSHALSTCAKISASHTGKKRSAESRAKQATTNTGKKVTAVTRAKISASSKGRKLSAGMLGRTHSAETKLKMSKANKGKSVSLETRQRQSIAAKNKPNVTEETKAKKSAAMKLYWAKQKELREGITDA